MDVFGAYWPDPGLVWQPTVGGLARVIAGAGHEFNRATVRVLSDVFQRNGCLRVVVVAFRVSGTYLEPQLAIKEVGRRVAIRAALLQPVGPWSACPRWECMTPNGEPATVIRESEHRIIPLRQLTKRELILNEDLPTE